MRSIIVGLLFASACHGSPPAESSGSGSGQSFHDGVQALCDLPDHVPDTGESWDKRLAAVGAWAIENVTNPEAKAIGDIRSLEASRDKLAAAVTKAAVAHCKLLDNGMALQSYADAMKVVCAAPSTHDAAYFKGHLLNPDVIRLFSALGDANPADRAKRMREAIAKAGLTSCALVEQMTAASPHAPKVTGGGFVEVDTSAPVVTATPNGIVVDGKSIVAINDGAVDPAELEGGAAGIVIPRVREFMKSFRAAQPGTRVQLMVDPHLTYKLLVELVFTIKQAGYSEFWILVAVNGVTKAVPITLRDAKPGPRPGLRPVVSIESARLVLWSLSGTEGTIKQPKLVAVSSAEIGAALAEIVARRWKTAKRSADDRSIVVMAGAVTPMQSVAETLAVVRATPDGQELFPEIDLSAGFE